MADILQGGKRDNYAQGSAFIITNFTERLSFDCNTATLGETSDTLATLIKELIRRGIVNGTVA